MVALSGALGHAAGKGAEAVEEADDQTVGQHATVERNVISPKVKGRNGKSRDARAENSQHRIDLPKPKTRLHKSKTTK
jgi:hypothetical protein